MSRGIRPPAQRTGLWVIWLLFAAGALFAVFEYFVRSNSGQWVEHATLVAARERVGSLSSLGFDAWWVQPVVIAIPATIFIIITLVRQRYVPALIAVAMVVGANVTTQLLKHQWLQRPDLDNGVPMLVGNSLPSGHTTFAASMVVAIVIIASPYQRASFALFAALYSSGVGIYTYTETWHRPADVIAAYLVVAIWALAAGWLVMRCCHQENTAYLDREPLTGPAAALAWFLGVVLSMAALLCFIFAGGWTGIYDASQNPSLWHLAAGLMLCTGPAFLISAAGINIFATETGRRQRGVDAPSSQGEQLVYAIPPQFAAFYRV